MKVAPNIITLVSENIKAAITMAGQLTQTKYQIMDDWRQSLASPDADQLIMLEKNH
jgi:hypothetical protein